jgi:hypothetical protein
MNGENMGAILRAAGAAAFPGGFSGLARPDTVQVRAPAADKPEASVPGVARHV